MTLTSILIKASIITAVVLVIIYFVFYYKKVGDPLSTYKIETSIKPFEFVDGLGSKYYVEVKKSGNVILSISEGINYLTEESKQKMYQDALAYIEKCKAAEK